jgi:hypothetical protein
MYLSLVEQSFAKEKRKGIAVPCLQILYTRSFQDTLSVPAPGAAAQLMMVSFVYALVCRFKNSKKKNPVPYILQGSQNQSQALKKC